VETGVALDSGDPGQPRRCILSQNYPNPFNAETRIDYIIPDGQPPQPTTLRIYNILGQDVRTLVDELQAPGIHSASWDGRDRSGEPVSSGMYFCQLKWSHHADVNKMVLLR
jgi:flagellar hook assembly protein FlgD